MYRRDRVRRVRARPRGGFSLVELMIAIVILAILASLVFLSMQSLIPRAELNSAVRDLAATLQETRSDAISRNAEFTVEYFFEEDEAHPRGFRVVTPFRAGGVGGLAGRDEERMAKQWHPLPDSVRFEKIALAGEEYASGKVAVRFDALGSATDHRVHLIQDPYGHQYTIEVLALTGMIRFHEGDFVREPPDDGDFR